ncbi:MAG TPA: sulfotransferase [Gemmataceae bacterium]|nr:sulfotransferase [Gemmataceae bacterium]
MDPFVFLIGCARSGTTLLQRIVDAHPQIAITSELHWITDRLKKPGCFLAHDGRITRELAVELHGHKRFRQFGFSPQEFVELLDHGQPVPHLSFLNGLFGLYARKKGKPLVGNKTPAYVQHVAGMHTLWPRARFVHLIRDGRDVWLSVQDWNHAERAAGRYVTWAEDPLVTTALWWKRKAGLGRQQGRALGPGLYYEIRYETLVTHPAEESTRLCAFLGVPYDGAMLRFHEGRTRDDPGLDAKDSWRPITRGLRDWRSQMPAPDVERFEAAAGDFLDELGYPRAYSRPSAEVLRHVNRIRESFTRDLRARHQSLPDSW